MEDEGAFSQRTSSRSVPDASCMPQRWAARDSWALQPKAPIEPAVCKDKRRARSILRCTRSLGSDVARQLRVMIARPDQIVPIFWAAGAIVTLSVVVMQSWPHDEFLALWATAGVFVAGFVASSLGRNHLPSWVLHIEVVIGSVLVTVLAAIGVSQRIPMASMYVWVVIFCALYFELPSVLAHCSLCGLMFAVVLATSPKVHDGAAVWLSIFGTAAVVGAIVLGLVNALRIQALQDPLTELPNRRWWDQRLEEEIARANRAGAPLSVGVMDLDGFKAINDTLGHQSGDRLLCELCKLWCRQARASGDFLARIGGDEFALIVPGLSHQDTDTYAQRLRSVVPHGISVSIGMASWDGKESAGTLLHRADQTMYREKLSHHAEPAFKA